MRDSLGMSLPVIEHQPEQHRFVCQLDHQTAVLSYQLLNGSVNFTHTFTPPEFRGRGVSTALVQAGLSWARDQKLEIHASCWFVQKFL